jgi:hypothetical protein
LGDGKKRGVGAELRKKRHVSSSFSVQCSTLFQRKISFENCKKARGCVSLVAVVIKKDSKNHVAGKKRLLRSTIILSSISPTWCFLPYDFSSLDAITMMVSVEASNNALLFLHRKRIE